MCKKYGNEHLVFVSCPEVLLGSMAQVRAIGRVKIAIKLTSKSEKNAQVIAGITICILVSLKSDEEPKSTIINSTYI